MSFILTFSYRVLSWDANPNKQHSYYPYFRYNIINTGNHAPRIHDLLRLAETSQLQIDEKMADHLDIITTFNISARYPDFKQAFYKKCTQDFAYESIKRIEEVRMWLKAILQTLPEK